MKNCNTTIYTTKMFYVTVQISLVSTNAIGHAFFK